ncbi:hypothetical protein [Paenibacillus sp. YPG26]|uniref:hypothetical protein n=1 Tax=Paenibacillus sp. YPG26 TaxID=2878915 RepID=UPI00203A3BC9|nr:hypothetical protein [Paenibacillus sp. YPG26]USB34075.1 hypothetical protein LDO05_04425 [Paenibacillus sp. YPG26]
MNINVHQTMAYNFYQPYRTQNTNIQKKDDSDNSRSFKDILSEKMGSSNSGLRK